MSVVEIDARVLGRQFPGGPLLAIAKVDASRDHQQSQEEQRWETEERDDAGVGAFARAKELGKIHGQQGEGTSGGQRHAELTEMVLTQIEDWPDESAHYLLPCISRTESDRLVC